MESEVSTTPSSSSGIRDGLHETDYAKAVTPSMEAMSVLADIDKDTIQTGGLAKSLLASISEIINSLACIKTEQESFFEFACYFYRISIVIMEMQKTQDTSKSSTDILESISENINSAKNIIDKSKVPDSTTDLRTIESELEGLVKQMGESLQLIPESTFGDQEYAEIAVGSLATEMQNPNSKDSQNDVSPSTKPQPQVIPARKTPKKESVETETDLYPTDMDLFSESFEFSSITGVTELHKSTSLSTSTNSQSTSNNNQRKYGKLSESLSMLPQVTQFIEPPYVAFICPLTKEIMEDPVTVETGVTYERKAITEWFGRFENPDEIYCPITGQAVTARLSNNIALKTIIEEWKVRNEEGRIKVAHAALTLAGSQSMIIEATKELETICEGKLYNKAQVRDAGMLPLLDKFLVYKDRDVKLSVLALLTQLAKDDDDGKVERALEAIIVENNQEMIAKTMDISRIIKFLPSSHQPMRHAALLFLLELSKSQYSIDMIGSVTGGILMLITTKYKRNIDTFASETADQILRNLEKSPENIKCMAENGFLEPLLNHLIGGDEEKQMKMARYLGEIVLGHDRKTYVAEKACPALIRMVQSENIEARRVAFKALAQISSYHANSQILVKAGIIKILAEEIFTKRMYSEMMNSRNDAAAILANILEPGREHESFQVNTHGHTLASDYFVYNVIHMLTNSTPDELNINLIRILLSLSKSSKTMATIVSVVKETEASYALIELINNPHEELGVAALKLLIALSPYIGHTLSERLCKTSGQPENLIWCPTETTHITEKHAVSAKFLATLPHQNLTLNLALVSKNAVSAILDAVRLIQTSGARTSRYAPAYLEGLVGILTRFTTTLYEPQMLFLAINHNLTSVFAELLVKASSDEVQRLSATGLENLSSVTMTLSKPPQIKSTNLGSFSMLRSLSISSSRKKQIPICPIHRGVCSSKNTFCLVDAGAVEKLLACLQSDKVEVVEAALSAICTLLDDRADVEKTVCMLSEMNVIQQVLDAVKEHKKESLWQKTFWMIERFLTKGGDKYASGISQDRILPAMLVTAFHRGDDDIKQAAENILRRLDKMPSFSTTYIK